MQPHTGGVQLPVTCPRGRALTRGSYQLFPPLIGLLRCEQGVISHSVTTRFRRTSALVPPFLPSEVPRPFIFKNPSWAEIAGRLNRELLTLLNTELQFGIKMVCGARGRAWAGQVHAPVQIQRALVTFFVLLK